MITVLRITLKVVGVFLLFAAELSTLSLTSHGEIWFNDETFSLYKIIYKIKTNVKILKNTEDTTDTYFVLLVWFVRFNGNHNGARGDGRLPINVFYIAGIRFSGIWVFVYIRKWIRFF